MEREQQAQRNGKRSDDHRVDRARDPKRGETDMRLKTSRIAALAGTLAVVGVMSVATTSASAKVILPTHEMCHGEEEIEGKIIPPSNPSGLLIGPVGLEQPVSGFMTVKKLGQSIALKNGRFAGTIGLCVREGLKVEGGIIKGEVGFPPFTAPLKILGIPTELGMEIKQFGEGEGTITRPAGNEEEEPVKLTLNVPAEANIAFTALNISGIKIPTQCETAQPVKLPLVKTLSLEELVLGTTITGTATLPNIKCRGLFGGVLGPVLSLLMSGPENAFSLTFGEAKPTE